MGIDRSGSHTGLDNATVYDRMNAGLSARPSSREVAASQAPPLSNPATQPGSSASATAAGPSNSKLVRSSSTTGIGTSDQAKKEEPSEKPTGAGSRTHRVNLDDLEAVHGICEGQNAPLRNQISDLRKQIEALDPTDEVSRKISQLQLDNLEFQQRQEVQMQ